MIPKLDNKEGVLLYPIDNAVFFVYSSGPVTSKGMPERFWFSFTFMRISANVFD
jgi:hypothetical protein